jgi:hypothetical protein
MPSRRSYYAAGFLLIALAGALVYLQKKSPENPVANLRQMPNRLDPKSVTPRRNPEARRPTNGLIHPRPELDTIEKSEYLLIEWKNLSSSGLNADELFSEKLKIINRAYTTLTGEAMMRFLDGLMDTESGDIVKSALMICIGNVASVGNHRMESWLSSFSNLKNQSDALTSLSVSLGSQNNSDEMIRLSTAFGNDLAVDSILKGFCFGLVANHPEDAVRTFIQKKRTGANFKDLIEVMQRLPKTADFEYIEKLLPDDSRSIAKDVRSSLIGTWASSSPQSATEYIYDNQERINPSQLGIALDKWMESDPRSAEDWITSIPAGNIRDIGLKSIAIKICDSDPQRAWNLAEMMNDIATKEATLKQVHKSWMQIDPKAAAIANPQLSGQTHE